LVDPCHISFKKSSDDSIVVLGALLGTQNGREVEIVNTFELAIEGDGETVDHGFLVSRRDQCAYNIPICVYIV